MSKRIIALTLLFSFLLASTSTLPKINASSSNDSGTAQEQAKAGMERIIDGASKAAIYDAAGRITKTTISISKNDKVDYGFKYDKQNRLQYLTRADGTQIGVEYNNAGQWQGFSFPDGGRLTFIRDDAGKIIRVKREGKSASRQSDSDARFVRASLMRSPDACRAAIRAAGYAAAGAAAICAGGPSIECGLAIAAAAEVAYIAYLTCKGPDGEIAIEESLQ